MKKLLLLLTLLLTPCLCFGQIASSSFDGTDDMVTYTKPSALTVGSDDITIIIWFYWTDGTDEDEIILSQADGTGTGRSILWIDSSQTDLNTAWKNASAAAACEDDGNVVANTWSCLSIVKDEGTSITMYQDDTQICSTTEGVEDATGDFRIGVAKVASANDYEGQLSYFMLVEDVLTQAEVDEVCQRPYAIFDYVSSSNVYIVTDGDVSRNLVGSGDGTVTGATTSSNGPPVALHPIAQ